jgi:protein-tyrosine phosphatase
MAEVVLSSLIAEAGLGDRVEVVSSGTGDWHVGDPMDRRAAATLTAHGYDASTHRAQQFHPSWLDDCDVVLAMDAANLADVGPGDDGRVLRFRDFDPRADGELDVPDPYYGADDGFERVLAIVRRTAAEIVRQLAQPGVLG